MQNKLLISLLPVIALFSFCQNLDPFLFSGEPLDNYSMDAYSGEQECDDALDSFPFGSAVATPIRLVSGSEILAAILLSDTGAIAGTDTVILFCHGNYGHIDYYWPRVRLLFETGYPVFVFDYRGYGKSTGSATEQGIYDDGEAALTFIRDSLNNPTVVVYGFSLGSLVATKLAAMDSAYRIKSLILESPIGSIQTIVDDAVYMDIPGSYVTTFKGSNITRISDITIPFLWFHGRRDEKLPIGTNGEPIWNNYSGIRGYCWRVAGAGHTDVPRLCGYQNYINAVRDFMQDSADANTYLLRK